MKTIKILVPIHTMPDIPSNISLGIENIISEFEKTYLVKQIWVVYKPNKFIQTELNSVKILDYHNFPNALKILKQEKPDIIFATPSFNFIDYAFSLAGRFLKIPVVSSFNRAFIPKVFPKSYINLIFKNSVSSDNDNLNHQVMRSGKFIFSKLCFLFKTQLKIKMNLFEIFKDYIIMLKLYRSDSLLLSNPRFSTTLHWLSSEDMVEPLIAAGYNSESLVVTGHPMFDKFFQKNLNSKPSEENDKIKILFAPASMYEHGLYTKEEQDELIKKIILALSKNKNIFELIVKIHPSSGNISNYSKIIKEIDSSIPIFQKGTIEDYLYDTDILLTYKSGTSDILAILANKPVIICNFLNKKGDLLIEKGLAKESRTVEELIQQIKESSSNPIDDEKIKKFIHDFFYKIDGKSSERICKAIKKITNI